MKMAKKNAGRASRSLLLFWVVLSLGLAACAPATSAGLAPLPMSTPIPPTSTATVTLTMGSWRTDDVEQMNRILAKFHEKNPSISVKYITYNTADIAVYNPIIETMLKQGTAPDLFYLTSYGFSRKLYNAGYLEPLDKLPGLKANFKPAMLAPWATDDNVPYGVPFIATSHAVYYNKDIFAQLNLKIPSTWEEFLQTASAIQKAGLVPLANATGEDWTMAEIVFMNLAPNFIGGYDGRKAYLDGKRCFNDAHMLSAFTAIQSIAPFLPANQQFLKYNDSIQLFLQGKTAMWLSGSWDIPFLDSQNPGFEWSVFAVPPPAGQNPYITFHLDAGMGLNAASNHKKEAELFLSWMADPEFGALLGNELPGFFPMHTEVPALENPHANLFLKLNEDRGTDVRFSWEIISDHTPDAYSLIMNGTIGIINGKLTPQQAADNLQAGLVTWYIPAQTCAK